MTEAGDDVKVPIYIQSAIHGNEAEGVDAMFELVELLATTPYGADPEVDAILDHVVLLWNVDQNPDGRILGQRANANNFDLNRDFLTQSQPETQAAVSIIQEWLPPDMLDQHGYVTPTLIESTTKPHNPSIDYDLWLKWNPKTRRRERGRHERGRPWRHPPDPRLVRERHSAAGKRDLRERPPARTRPSRGLGRLGPLLHTNVLAARRAEWVNGRNVQLHRHALRRHAHHPPPAWSPWIEGRPVHRRLVNAAVRSPESPRPVMGRARDLPARRHERAAAGVL